MDEHKSCWIFAAGTHFAAPPDPALAGYIIAADGGFTYLQGHHITPDLVIGDFDSLRTPPPSGAIVLPQVKDDTDTAAAIRAGWQRGFRSFHIYGGTGGRIDHTLANIQCLAQLANRGGQGYLFDESTVITAIRNGCICFPAGARGIVSVFAHGETASGVYEDGLKYSLTDARLSNTIPLGVSNEFTGVPASIRVKAGTLIVVYPRGVTPYVKES